MIRIDRGTEPECLPPVRKRELAKLRGIELLRAVEKDDIAGYEVVKEDIRRKQHGKCCYCELKVYALFNDVEHFRPKARADRKPGVPETHGYFWLAFTWENLLFACPLCNRANKNARFPLAARSRALSAWEDPPGDEKCLLIDPAAESGVPHLQFVPLPKSHSRISALVQTSEDILRWTVQPRAGSERGKWSIDVFGLNHQQHMDLYRDHVRLLVDPRVAALRAAMNEGDGTKVVAEVKGARNQLLVRSAPYVALSYDALRYFVPDRLLAPFHTAWPAPKNVGDPPRPAAHDET